MIDKERMMIIEDEDGNEIEVEILFTFESEDYNRQYVVFTNPDNEDEAFAYAYDDDKNLIEITDEKELAMVDEMLGAFINEEEQ